MSGPSLGQSAWRLGALAVALLASAAAAQDLEKNVHELKLSNGMVWLIVERPTAPVFTGFVRVRAGGADEEPGYTGLAHLFEHMAFKGTEVLGTSDWAAEKKLLHDIALTGDALAELERAKNSGPQVVELKSKVAALAEKHKGLTDENALARLYQVNGGVGLNATTDKDMTSYFVSLPKNRLELWATAEAARLAAPVLRDFYTERSVVQEERRMSIESSPVGMLYEKLNQTAFSKSPYQWPTVGYGDELAVMPLYKAEAFFRDHYGPGNAVGCLVGDVKFDEVKPLLERTFGAIPARPIAPDPQANEPMPTAQRRAVVSFEAGPRLFLAFPKPAPPAHDDFVFDVMQALLSDGRTSRLQQRLVYKDHLAQSVGVFNGPGVRLDGLMIISVVPLAGVPLERIESALWDELNALKTVGATNDELEKVRNNISTDFARSIESNSGLASALSRAQTLFGDWRYVQRVPREIAAIDANEVKAAAAKYFTVERSVVVTLERKAAK